jgi:hypothetical protein
MDEIDQCRNPMPCELCRQRMQSILDMGAAAERERGIADHRAEQDAVHADLSQLLRVLGLGDHARPQSPHEVMLDAINEAGRLRQSAEAIRAGERERIRHLAMKHEAQYLIDRGGYADFAAFADLLDGDSDDD